MGRWTAGPQSCGRNRCWNDVPVFGSCGFFCEGDVGACNPLKVAATSIDSFLSVTPTIGTVGGEEDMEVVADGCRGAI